MFSIEFSRVAAAAIGAAFFASIFVSAAVGPAVAFDNPASAAYVGAHGGAERLHG
jgi:hypothetical protein